MKKTLLLAATLACSVAVGQQDKVWSCIILTQAEADSDGSGFFWESLRSIPREFIKRLRPHERL
ncbi:hypothetical protein OAD56_00520 [Gammaproteobacteria bacterium]|jgi:hypothetical protein|nr:hypothetical protein [Gammaproteobacteria bacterium]MDA9367468.1 hypothetical protein [bacterium]MDA9783500.1 hypothetical protein [Gammaproteobacteria bacterium]MDB9949870.1 hypothetical protein [Gammaproteobacteria bacterium]MDC3362095.1 hypothetical protein [Gammaproteobacteria bacterium]